MVETVESQPTDSCCWNHIATYLQTQTFAATACTLLSRALRRDPVSTTLSYIAIIIIIAVLMWTTVDFQRAAGGLLLFDKQRRYQSVLIACAISRDALRRFYLLLHEFFSIYSCLRRAFQNLAGFRHVHGEHNPSWFFTFPTYGVMCTKIPNVCSSSLNRTRTVSRVAIYLRENCIFSLSFRKSGLLNESI